MIEREGVKISGLGTPPPLHQAIGWVLGEGALEESVEVIRDRALGCGARVLVPSEVVDRTFHRAAADNRRDRCRPRARGGVL